MARACESRGETYGPWLIFNIHTPAIGAATRMALCGDAIQIMAPSHFARRRFVNSFVPPWGRESLEQGEGHYYCYSQRRPRLHKRGRWNWEAINLGRLPCVHVWAAKTLFFFTARQRNWALDNIFLQFSSRKLSCWISVPSQFSYSLILFFDLQDARAHLIFGTKKESRSI